MDVNNVSRIFQSFMVRVVALEDMAKQSGQNLTIFQQELEMFQRSPLNKSSVLAQALASSPSERLQAYQEAGYRHCHTDHAVVVKLDNALKDLQNHVQQARAVIHEIQRLLDEANGIMHENLSTRLGNIVSTEGAGTSENTQTADNGQSMNFPQTADTRQRAGYDERTSVQVTSPKTKVRQLFTPDYVTTMACCNRTSPCRSRPVHIFLRSCSQVPEVVSCSFRSCSYTHSALLYDVIASTKVGTPICVTERVVGTLGLDLPSELLQNYHMMWTLRPFVDETVVEEALSWTRLVTGF